MKLSKNPQISGIKKKVMLRETEGLKKYSDIEDRGFRMPGVVMGSIDENWYRYGIDTQISFRKSPSQTSHLEVRHLFRRISTFGLRIFSKSLGFFNICPVSALFQVTAFKFCSLFLGGGGHFWSLFQ